MPENSPRPQGEEFEFDLDLDLGDETASAPPPQAAEQAASEDEDAAVIRRPAKRGTSKPDFPKSDPVAEGDSEVVVKRARVRAEPAPAEPLAEPQFQSRALESPVATPAQEQMAPAPAVADSAPAVADSGEWERSTGRNEAREAVATNRRKERALGHLEPLGNYRQADARPGRRFAIIAIVVAVFAVGVALFLLKSGGVDEAPVATDPGERSDGGAGGEADSGPETGDGRALVGHPGEGLADIEYRISESLKGFLAAGSPGELRSHIRDAERVMPLVEDHYSRHPFELPRLKKVDKSEEGMVDLKTFWVVDVTFEDGDTGRFVMQDSDRGFVVDWGMFVHYNPIDWDAYTEQRPAEAMVFRVFATRDFRVGYAFPAPSGWVCVRLRSLGSERELYGYVVAGSQTAIELEELLDGDWENGCMLELQFPADPKGGDDQVHVRALVSDGWLMVD